jgi:hypothetical protein
MSGKRTDLVLTNFYNPHMNGGGLQRNNPTNNAQMLTENMYRRNLTELACNRFEWQGLPESVNPRFLELVLFYNALSVFYKDKNTDKHFATRGSGLGGFNAFDDPTSFTVIGTNLQPITLSAKKCVPIYANYLRIPDLDIVTLYSQKLANIDRTKDIAIGNMRHPKIIKAAESTRLSWENINRQIDEGVQTIKVSQSLNMDDIEVLDLSMPSGTLNDLRLERNQLWNECMGLLGINNANQDKKERLVAAEVGANDEQVDATRNIALNARQQACEQINDMWPELNISVDFKHKADAPAADAADTETGDE